MITVKRAIIPFIKITSQRSMGLTFAILQKTVPISLFYTQTKKVGSVERWGVIKLQIQIVQLIQHRIQQRMNFIHVEEV